jgi:hypothetical protein
MQKQPHEAGEISPAITILGRFEVNCPAQCLGGCAGAEHTGAGEQGIAGFAEQQNRDNFRKAEWKSAQAIQPQAAMGHSSAEKRTDSCFCRLTGKS